MKRTYGGVGKMLDNVRTDYVAWFSHQSDAGISMTRVIAMVLPAGLLGCLTMSAALVVGRAEIGQLRPRESRMVQVVETVESPFRVIAGLLVPEPAPPRESAPSPSAAAASAPNLGLAAPAVPADELVPAELPSDVPDPSLLRRRANRTVAALPAPAQAPAAQAVDDGFRMVHDGPVLGLGFDFVWARERELVHPVVVQAWKIERATVHPVVVEAQKAIAPIREPANAAVDAATPERR